MVEKVKEKVKMLREGKSPIYEPGLEDLIKEGISKGTLHFTDDLKEGVKFSDVIFICVGTPPRADGSADLSHVEEVVRTVARNMDSYKVIVEKSTVPVGTHRLIERVVRLYLRDDIPFEVASNPEFLREGFAVKDFLEPFRIVVGVNSEKAKRIFEEIYRPITQKGYPLLITDPATAEIIKYASNAFLATKISFINMVADLCEKVGGDVEAVAKGMGYDPRIGDKFLKAGVGYGGSCLPKDVKAFIKTAKDFGLDFGLLEEVEKINASRVQKLVEKLERILLVLSGKEITVWGLTFKPGTDDVREAPSLRVIPELLKRGAKVKAYDPKGIDNFRSIFKEGHDLRFFTDKYEALKGSHALVILTEWDEFKEADLERVRELLEAPVIVDGRNIFDPEEIRNLGFEYECMGRCHDRENYLSLQRKC